MPLYFWPLCRSGLVIRPAAYSAFHGLSQGLTPRSSCSTMPEVTRV